MADDILTATIVPFRTKAERAGDALRAARLAKPKRTTTYGVARRRFERSVSEAVRAAHTVILQSAFDAARREGLGRMSSDTLFEILYATVQREFNLSDENDAAEVDNG